MTIEILILILGLALIVFGANILTEGSASLARRFRISELAVGLTVIAIGTSTPELIISSLSAVKGHGDMAIGNVVGSNVFNIFIILGVTALITPLRLTRLNIRRDIVYMLVASILFAGLALFNDLFGIGKNEISRMDGIFFLIFFIAFIWHTLRQAVKSRDSVVRKIAGEQFNSDGKKDKKMIVMILLIVGGLLGLIVGGELFLENAKSLAERAGISDAVIAITLMAGGTSLPEFASCIAAARRGKGQMALGNVIGSNITNIFLVIGTSATISPLSLGDITENDLGMVVFSALALMLSAFLFRKHQVDKTEGVLFILMYVAYIGYIVFV